MLNCFGSLHGAQTSSTQNTHKQQPLMGHCIQHLCTMLPGRGGGLQCLHQQPQTVCSSVHTISWNIPDITGSCYSGVQTTGIMLWIDDKCWWLWFDSLNVVFIEPHREDMPSLCDKWRSDPLYPYQSREYCFFPAQWQSRPPRCAGNCSWPYLSQGKTDRFSGIPEVRP